MQHTAIGTVQDIVDGKILKHARNKELIKLNLAKDILNSILFLHKNHFNHNDAITDAGRDKFKKD